MPFLVAPPFQHLFRVPFKKKKKKKKTKQIAALRPSLKAELKNELTEELSASGALVADAGPEPGPIRWIAEAFSFYRGQTVLLEETLRDTIGGAKAALLEGTLDEGPEWDIGYTSKKRCTDIEGQTKAGQRSCCIPRLQTLTWKDSLAEALVKQFGPQRAFNVTPPSFLIPEQLAEWRHWAKNNEPPGTAWVLVTHVDPLRAYLFDGGIFESNTKHLTYWQTANEGVLGKAGGGGGDKKDEKAEHTALGADNEKPTPWALPRLRKFVGDATGKRRREGLLLLFCCFSFERERKGGERL